MRAEEAAFAENLDLRPDRQEHGDRAAADLLAVEPGIDGAGGARSEETPLPEERGQRGPIQAANVPPAPMIDLAGEDVQVGAIR